MKEAADGMVDVQKAHHDALEELVKAKEEHEEAHDKVVVAKAKRDVAEETVESKKADERAEWTEEDAGPKSVAEANKMANEHAKDVVEAEEKLKKAETEPDHAEPAKKDE